MAHELDDSNGRYNMAYIGKEPWHGLGHKLTEGAPLEVWCKEAGFDWQVISSRVLFHTDEHFNGEARIAEFPKRNVLWRSDTKAPLSLVSDDYEIFQPRDVAEFFRDLIETSQFKMETMGMLNGGKKYWALAKADDQLTLAGGDTILPYLLLATSCDCTMSNIADFTSIRVVCQNTLSAAIGVDGRHCKIRIPHSRKFDADEVKKNLGITVENWMYFKSRVIDLSKFKIDRDRIDKYFASVVGGEDDDKDSKANTINRLRSIYYSGVGQQMESTRGTAWGLVNAVTRWVDHERTTSTADSRLNYAWFGVGNTIKNRAFDNALKLVA